MANETPVQTSSNQENHKTDDRENIPPGVTAAAGTSQLKVHVRNVEGYSCIHPSAEDEPLPDTCTFSTPAPSSSSGGVKAKSRLSGLQSALTPILKYLNITNKCPSPEPLNHGKNPHPTVPSLSFGNTTSNCQKSAEGSSQHPNSGCSLGDTNASVCWLADEYLPEISLFDVTCDASMQLTKNHSPLPDSVPSTPATARSLHTFVTPLPSQPSASIILNTTAQIPCPQNKTLNILQSDVSSPKAESEVRDQASSVSRNASEMSLLMNQSSSTVKPSVTCDVKDVTFDRGSLQNSSGNTVLEAGTTNQNGTFNIKPWKQIGTTAGSQTCSSDNHQTVMEKSSSFKVCSGKEVHSQVRPLEIPQYQHTPAGKDPNTKMGDIPESIDAPLRWLDDRYFPEITLLDVTRDSEFSPGGEMSSLEVTRENNMLSSAPSGQIVTEPGTLDTVHSEDLSGTLDGNVTHTISSFSEQSDKCVGENLPKASLEVTRDISMGSVLEDSRPSLESSAQNPLKIPTSDEDINCTHPANITHDISSSSDMSVQSAASQFPASDSQCNTSSKNVTSELHGEPVVTSVNVEANNKELGTSHGADELTSRVPQPSPQTTESVNNTFTVTEQSSLSASANVNTSAQVPCPQNQTLDLPSSNVNSPKPESDTKDQETSVSKNTTESSPVINQNYSAGKPNDSSDMQNVTFDRRSFQKSASSATISLQNNTFDAKSPSKQNCTVTVSETSSSNGHQNTLDKPSSPKVCNATSSPKDDSEVPPPELIKHNGTTASTDPNAKMVDTAESTFEANPAVEAASGAGQHETQDHSQSGLPMREGFSDTLDHPSMDTEDNKANILNLDDTLDLRADSLITSTPMTNCKIFNFHAEREEGKIAMAQKKLYGDGPSKPDGQMPSDVPSNIVCNRKTFLTQPTAKSLLPPLKTASQLLKCKPASTLPGRFEPLTSGLPMTRQRTQAEVLRNRAASDVPQVTTGISSSYNLRATTTGSKQPNTGLQKPRLSSIPSGIQRAALGLRPPSARSNTAASSSTDKLRGPTVTNPETKTSQAKRHPLTRGEALPVAKRKKMDAPLSSGNAEAPASSCDAANRAKNLKQPTNTQKTLSAKTQKEDVAVPACTAETSTSCSAVSRVRALKQPAATHRALPPKSQVHGCTKCVMLEQQLEKKSEEIRRLKEELLKYSKCKEEC
uniref:uncharacterized protein LOC124052255 n=1 Tax=Scatophagus argus TaxID=75038 RepID=UPI001ED7DA8D|nr:uncharacterized protein LOC124052255 [Scatophagus argus]